MKKVFIILISFVLVLNVAGQDDQLILNIEPLPDNTLTSETPIVLSLQYINETDMEEYMDQYFLQADKARIDSLHRTGVISDSLYRIYQSEWPTTEQTAVQEINAPSNIVWESVDAQGNWNSIELNVHPLNNTSDEEQAFTSDMLFYGIDASDVNALKQVNSLRAMSNGNSSNPIQIKLSDLTQQNTANTEGQLYYISNYWTLRQDHQKALEYADRIIEMNPNAFSGFYQRGVSQYHLNQKERALETFEQAFELVSEEQFGIEPPDRLLEYYYRLQGELLQPQKN